MLEIRATRQPEWINEGIELRIIDKKTRSIARITMEPHEEGCRIEPTCNLSIEKAQELMNSLWECGLRPIAAAGSVGQLSATERHLEDMRRIAFGCLEKQIK